MDPRPMRLDGVCRTLLGLLVVLAALAVIHGRSSLYAGQVSPSLKNVTQLTPRGSYIAPVWSPASEDHIAFSRDGYTAIYLMTPSNASITPLSFDIGSGFQFRWTPKGEHIVYRAQHDSLSWVIRAVNVSTRQILTLSLPGRDVGLPSLSSSTEIAYLAEGKLEERSLVMSPGGALHRVERPVAFQRDDQIFIASGGKVSLVSKPPGKYYLPRLSPDGMKVVYEEISRGLYVSNTDGSDVFHVGLGNNANWSPDSTYVIYELPRDDGHDVVSSDLYVADVTTRRTTQLTHTPFITERRPSFSAGGQRIAFDANGAIYAADFIH